ncbi:MAG: hypothetical protein HQK49_09375 [Oligoflexia bacterium]|nr:hypothetical protein [Oligoflexia bacterium]
MHKNKTIYKITLFITLIININLNIKSNDQAPDLEIFEDPANLEKLEKVDVSYPLNSDGTAYHKIYNDSYDLVWKAVVHEIANYELKYINKLTGEIKTRWIDNTTDVSFLEEQNKIAASKYSLVINIKKVLNTSKEQTLVTIFKREQFIEDTNNANIKWQLKSSDGIFEQSFFYRIGRLLNINSIIAKEFPTIKATPVSTPISTPTKNISKNKIKNKNKSKNKNNTNTKNKSVDHTNT